MKKNLFNIIIIKYSRLIICTSIVSITKKVMYDARMKKSNKVEFKKIEDPTIRYMIYYVRYSSRLNMRRLNEFKIQINNSIENGNKELSKR